MGESLSTTWMKYFLFSLNIFVFILGLAILGAGIWFRVTQLSLDGGDVLNMGGLNSAAYVVIVIGVFLVVIGFFGCFGTLKEISMLLILYFVVILILVILEIVAIVFVWKLGSGNKLQEILTSGFKKAIDQRSQSDVVANFIDYIQGTLECCGGTGPEDYQEGVPDSCSNYYFVTTQRGCGETMKEYLEVRANVVTGISAALIVLQVLCLILTSCLLKEFRNYRDPGIEAAADVQIAYVSGKDYEKSKALMEEQNSDKQAKKQKEKEAKEEKKRRKEEEKKQKKESANKKEKESTKETKAEDNMATPTGSKVAIEDDQQEMKEDEGKMNSTDKEIMQSKERLEQKKLAEEAQRTLEEKQKKRAESTEGLKFGEAIV